MANYPTSLPSTTPADHTAVNDEIVALATEIGTTPSGSFSSVRERLEGNRRTLDHGSSGLLTIPGCFASASTAVVSLGSANRDYYFPFHCEDYLTFDQLALEVTTATGAGGSTGRVAIYSADAEWQPVTLIEDFGTFANDSTGVKTLAPAGTTRTLTGGRYLFALNQSVGASYRNVRGTAAGLIAAAALGSNANVAVLYVARTYAAFSASPTAWTSQTTDNSSGFLGVIFMRVTAVGS